MSKNYSTSNNTQRNVASSSKTTLKSSSYQYSSASSSKTTTTTTNYSNKLNNDYKSKYITASNTGSVVRQPQSIVSTLGTRPTYTPVYSNSSTTFTSINRPPKYGSASSKNESILKELVGSKSKPSVISKPNKSHGLFYTFDDKESTVKQPNTVVPPMVTASSFSSSSAPKPIERPVTITQSVGVEKPAGFSFKNLFSSKAKRGYALILNHYKYVNNYQSTREGTQFDVTQLEHVFDYYRIETHVKSDLSLSQIKSEVNILKYKDFSKYDCFIIVILTHGNRNEMLCASDKSYNVIEVIEDPLLIENKSLLNKPKIFVIQACRGGDEMPVIETDSVTALTRRHSTVAKRNIFKCNATYEGYVSYRHTKYGTVFIQTFCQKLKEIGRTASIYDVMTKVIEEVSNDPEIPQVPTVVSSMTNSFCFGQLLK